MEERSIIVNGQSKLSVSPDITVISMDIISLDYEYNTAIDNSKEKLTELRKCLNRIGFNNDEIKSREFQVTTKYENVKDDDGNLKKVFKGYEVINRLRIEFSHNSMLLGKIINVIASCVATPEFNVSYELRDNGEFQNKLIEAAIKNAQEKAELMCATAKVKIGKVLKIEGGNCYIGYSNSNVIFLKGEESNINLQPLNINGEASVIMVWRIEG